MEYPCYYEKEQGNFFMFRIVFICVLFGLYILYFVIAKNSDIFGLCLVKIKSKHVAKLARIKLLMRKLKNLVSSFPPCWIIWIF